MTKKECCLMKTPMYGTIYNNSPHMAGMLNEISTGINMLKTAYDAEENGQNEHASRFYTACEVLVAMTHNRWECNKEKVPKMIINKGDEPKKLTFKSSWGYVLNQWIDLGNIPKKDKKKYMIQCNSKGVTRIGL